jgi:selenocysteine-specific elongation factor
MIIGTAGHVDHGKTSLIRALTGVDTDRLAEEKARGISIELGFAYADFGDAQAEPVGFIDVPGHRRFVQTMIAGAAGIDLGLLVVAADDGPMPQTREHLDILRWLGVTELVVALSKVDAVDAERRDAAALAIDALLDESAYRGAPVVPVSSVSRQGLDALRAALLAHRGRAARDVAPHFRLAIDRAFVLQGIGLVVTGTCFAGRVAIDDRLTLLPGGLEARVRGIHAQNRAVQVAHAGQRVALNLSGRGVEKSTVHRGDWIVDPAIAIETDRIDVRLAPSDRATSLDARHWRGVRFHAGAASVNARVALLDDADEALAQIVFEHPLHIVAGDRFVLRDASSGDGESGSLAGGIVLDVDVPTRGRRAEPRLAFLRVAARGDAQATLADAVARAAKGIDLARWNVAHNTAFTADAVTAHAVGDTLFAIDRWDAMRSRVLATLADEHARAPDAVGPARDRLRRMAAPAFDAATFGALVDGLKNEGRLSQTGAWLHLPDHRVELLADDRALFARTAALLRDAAEPNNPPRVRDLARALTLDEAALRGLFVRLASRGEVYRVAHDHYFLPTTVQSLARIAAEVAEQDGVARAAPFRDRIGVGRKVAIQILEFFDRVGYSRRVGDDHRVIQPSLFDG